MKKRKQPDSARYSYVAVLQEFVRVIDEMPRGTKTALAVATGLDKPGFWKRMAAMDGYFFSIEQFGAIADELEAPAGWPFVKWNEPTRSIGEGPRPPPEARAVAGRLVAAELRRVAKHIEALADDMTGKTGSATA